MKEFWNTIQLVFAAVGGWLGYFLGGCDGLLIALIIFVVCDYLTGIMCAIADKKLSSEVGFKGICRKVLIFLLVGIGNVIDVQVLGHPGVIRTAIIFFYSYMHNRRTKNGHYQEYWNCGSKKKKKVGAGCPVGGTISQKALEKACYEVLGLEELDEEVFLDKVDHIEVPEKYTLDFFLKDGTCIRKDAPNTGHQDCWTAEYRAKVSKQRRKKGTNPKGATCFTAKIKCAECGNNYRRQTRTKSTGEKYYLYACATTNTCSNNCIHEDTLRELSAKALGLEEFDEELFKEKIDHITIAPGGHITFCFYDGHEEALTYSTKRRMPGWTEERRKKQTEAIKASFTEERRRKMSETMKKIRSERYWASTKAKK